MNTPPTLCSLFFFKQKTAYEMATCLEFRRVLFRSLYDSQITPISGGASYPRRWPSKPSQQSRHTHHGRRFDADIGGLFNLDVGGFSQSLCVGHTWCFSAVRSRGLGR